MAEGLEGHVFRAASDRSVLAELLAGRFGQEAVAIVRRADDAQFVPFDPSEADALITSWTEGQVFDAESEVRWRSGEDVYDVLILTERNDLPAGFRELRESPFAVVIPSSDDAHGFLLWGTDRTPKGWVETRIPRLLNYPFETKGKLRLAYKLYEHEAAVRWVRFSSLKEAK